MSDTTPVSKSHNLSALAVEDLARSGIAPTQAERAGIFSVGDASTIYPEFKKIPCFVIPYFGIDGELMTFERDGERLPFCRIRYLQEPKQARGFTKSRKPRRYDQPTG